MLSEQDGTPSSSRVMSLALTATSIGILIALATYILRDGKYAHAVISHLAEIVPALGALSGVHYGLNRLGRQ